MKKILSVFLLLAMLLPLAACGGDKNGGDGSRSPQDASALLGFAFVPLRPLYCGDGSSFRRFAGGCDRMAFRFGGARSFRRFAFVIEDREKRNGGLP